jgi:hypothetical protein
MKRLENAGERIEVETETLYPSIDKVRLTDLCSHNNGMRESEVINSAVLSVACTQPH